MGEDRRDGDVCRCAHRARRYSRGAHLRPLDSRKSGRSYHVKFHPPKSLAGQKPSAKTMLDDVTGEPLMQRGDDTVEALRNRLVGYHKSTVPVFKHYEPEGIVHKIDANQAKDKVWAQIAKTWK